MNYMFVSIRDGWLYRWDTFARWEFIL